MGPNELMRSNQQGIQRVKTPATPPNISRARPIYLMGGKYSLRAAQFLPSTPLRPNAFSSLPLRKNRSLFALGRTFRYAELLARPLFTKPMPHLTRSLALLLPLAVFPLLTSAQTADEIIAKNIQARGGLEKIKSLQTLRTTGKISVGGMRISFVEENKRPFKVREEQILQGMVGIDAYDGKIAWHVVPWEGRKDPDLLSADDRKGLIEDADIEGQLVDYKNKDHRVEYSGHDLVEGTDCYKLKLTLATGDVRYYFIDCDTFLELKEENEINIRGTVRYTETFYGDYEKVDGIYFPFAMETGNKGDTERVRITVDQIVVNPPLADSRFTMPTAPGAHK